MVTDTAFMLNNALAQGKSVLAEGANAALLDIDHGTYPFVTSSATAAGGIATGLGIAPNKIACSVGVVKAYTTRVGSGPFPTELLDSIGQKMRDVGHEYGTTTGRPRRCGWLDIPVVQYSHMLNNYSSLNITKLDVLSDLDELQIGVAYTLHGKRLQPGMMPSVLEDLAEVKVEYETMKGWKCDISKARSFAELPANAQAYLKRVEQLCGVPVSWVGVGAGRLDMATNGFKA
jgi:adenylosuccinate synthase